MTSFKFKQIDATRALLFIVLYISTILFLIFAIFGFENVLNFINSFQRGTFVGLLAAIIFIPPLLFLAKRLYAEIELSIDEEKITIRKKNKTMEIMLYEITEMSMNKTQLGALDFYGKQNKMLFQCRPYNDSQMIKKIISTLTKQISFRKTTEHKRAMGGQYDVLIYRAQQE